MKAINLKSEILANKELIQLGDRHTLLFVKILFLSDKNGKFDFCRLFEGERELAKSLEEKGLIISYEAGNTTIGIIKKRSLFINDNNKNLNTSPNLISVPSDEATTLTTKESNGFEILKKSSEKFPFSEWWNLYNKKVGRESAEAYWNRLSLADKQLAFEHTRNYIIAQPDKQFRKDPAKYLNKRAFKDEIIHGNNSTTKREQHSAELSSLAARSEDFLKQLAG